MHETNLTFCASYEDGTSTSKELHRAYEKTALFGVALLISQPSVGS